jgi:hypothetical protein
MPRISGRMFFRVLQPCVPVMSPSLQGQFALTLRLNELFFATDWTNEGRPRVSTYVMAYYCTVLRLEKTRVHAASLIMWSAAA